MKDFKYFLLCGLVCLIFYWLILREIIFVATEPKIPQKIQIEMMDGSTKIFWFKIRRTDHLQINHHYSYNKYDYYNLECTPTEVWGHWTRVKDSVVNFKVLEIKAKK